MNSYMFSFLRFFGHTPKNKLNEVTVPDDILEMGLLYPVLHLLVGNNSTGEIKLFDKHDNKRIGQALLLNRDKEVWVYLGNGYFKNIVKL